MSRGHRRTQSGNIVLTTSDSFSNAERSQITVSQHQIVTLLAKSSDKIQEKVSNIEVLHSQSMPENSFFQFGKNSNRNSQISRSRHLEEEYMIGGSTQNCLFKIPQEPELNYLSHKPFGKKGKTGMGVTHHHAKPQRTPFLNTLNISQGGKKCAEGRECLLKREMKIKRGEEKRRV